MCSVTLVNQIDNKASLFILSVQDGSHSLKWTEKHVNSTRSRERNDNCTWHILIFNYRHSPLWRFSTVHIQGRNSAVYITKHWISGLNVGYMIFLSRLHAINRTEAGNEKVGFAIKQTIHFKYFSVAHLTTSTHDSQRYVYTTLISRIYCHDWSRSLNMCS